jgi:hypothetical protein
MAADFVGLAAHCSLCQNQCVVFANGFSTSPIESQEFHSNSIPVTLWKITIFNGKIHYKWPFSIAMLNYQRVVFSNPTKSQSPDFSPRVSPKKFAKNA